MTRVFDEPTAFAGDALDGFAAANQRYVARVEGGVVRSTQTPAGQVALVVGGGSGHYPAFAGLVGVGLASGAVCGNVFTSPSARQAYAVAKLAHRGGGVLFSFGNYAGDVLHFAEASERLAADGIDVRTVLCTDDIASAPAHEIEKRRGIAGDFTVFKIAGAAAERGLGIDEVERLARLANARTRTLGVAFAGCTLPGQDHRLFDVEPGQMSVGLGIHGEPGVSDAPIPSARELAVELVERLLQDVPQQRGERLGVIVNGLGTVKYEELFILYKHVAQLLEAQGLTIVDPECGELVTSLDMAGLSVTLFWLDDELEPLWRDPADTPAYRKGVAPVRARVDVDALHAATGEHRRHRATDASAAASRVAARQLHAAEAVVRENLDELGRIDAIAGDGDHGFGMQRGLAAASASADAAVVAGLGVRDLLVEAGAAWSDEAGGTSGALWGAFLAALGDSLGDRDAYEPRQLADAVTAAVGAVMRLGKAQPGDKTMVDAMVPYAQELAARVGRGEALPLALSAAAASASQAAAATSALRPRLGRARPLAERSVGHPDAGATSFALIAERLAHTAVEA